MSNPKTFGDLARSLTAYIQGIDGAEARRRINVAYWNEAVAHPWPFLIKEIGIQTEAAYATGTVSVTNGLTAVTLTGGTWSASWTTAPSQRRIAITGRFEPYNLTITGTGTGTLSEPWIGETNATAAYRIWRDKYPMPADAGYSKLIGLWDVLLRFRLQFKNQPIFLRDRMYNAQLVNYPVEFTTIEMSGEAPPRAQIQMYPPAVAVREYLLYYFGRVDFMTTDTEYPKWPAEFQDILPLSAAIAHYETPRFYSPKYLLNLKPRYADMYASMVKAFDGNAALDQVIEEATTGRARWPGSNANWSPSVLGAVGVEMTKS